MKKKVLALLISVVMIASLLVPMMAAHADETAVDVKFRIGEVVEANGYLKVPVYVDYLADDADLFAIRFQILSDDNLAAIADSEEVDSGFKSIIKGAIKDIEVTLGGTVGTSPEGTEKTGFQCVLDANPTKGGVKATGHLMDVYFAKPAADGEYTFTFNWMDGCRFEENKKLNVEALNTGFYLQNADHTKKEVITKEAGCETTGEKAVVCEKCGLKLSSETIPALDHDWEIVGTSTATCTEPGTTNYKCKRCDATKTEKGKALGHDFTVKLDDQCVAPTCTEDGMDVYKCSRCDETTDKKVNKLGHDYVKKNTVEPTCTEAGYTNYECSRCQDVQKRDEVAALGHSLVVEIVEKATAEKNGKIRLYCIHEGCKYEEFKEEYKLEKEVKAADNISVKNADPVLPGDLQFVEYQPEEEIKTESKANLAGFFFDSQYVNLLEGEHNGEVTIDLTNAGDKGEDLTKKYENFAVYTSRDNDQFVKIDSKFENGKLIFTADLTANYILGADEIPAKAGTADAVDVVLFAGLAMMALAAALVITKKKLAR